MNKITKQHYPAAKLPDELRVGMKPDGHVTVTVVEEEDAARATMTREELRALIESGRSEATDESVADAVARVRRLRDEWDG